MSVPTQLLSLPLPCSASQIVVQGGVTPIPSDTIQGTPAVYSAVSAIGGWNITEAAGSTAKIRLRDGITATSRLIATISLAANAQSNHSYAAPPSLLNNGIYIEVVSGSVEGSVQFG